MFSTPFTAGRDRRPPRPRFQPRLELLEDRLVPAAYALADLGSLSAYSNKELNAINNSGQIVGSATDSSGDIRALLYNNGQWTDLGAPGGFTSSIAFGINNAGQIAAAGFNLSSSGDITSEHAFLYSNGQWTDLGVPDGYTESVAVGINNSGQILVDGKTSSSHGAFLYSNGQYTNLAPSGSLDILPIGINDSGQIVASVSTSTAAYVDLYSNGQWTDLGAPSGYTFKGYLAINNSGQIIADTTTSTSSSQAYLYSNGQWTSLGSLGTVPFNQATGINDSGQVVGFGVDSNGDQHALLFSNGQITDLNNVLPAGSTLSLSVAQAIKDNGQIVAGGSDGQPYLLTPTTLLPVITGNPNNLTVTAGGITTFSASASSTLPLTVQWYDSSDGGQTWNNLGSQAASDTLTFTGASTAYNGYEFRAVFTNSAGSVPTSAATLTVTAPAPLPAAAPSSPSPPSPPVLDVPPLLSFFDGLLGGTETTNANGTETITDNFFGIPLLVSTFDHSGKLVSVDLFGAINVTFLFG